MHASSLLTGKRILFVFNNLHLGGAERQALLLARCLVEQYQAEVEFWGFREAGRAADLCSELGIPWRIVPFQWAYNKVDRVRNLLRLAWHLRRANPDIIMPYTMLPNVVCGLVWRLSGAELCIWNQRDEGRDRFHPSIERWAARLTPWFISNARHGADFLSQSVGVDVAKIAVIYNGVDLPAPEAGRQTWRAKLGVDENDFLACMVANLTPYKDHATLLRAWRIVIDRVQPTDYQLVLLLAGRLAAATDSLKALAYDLELGSSIRFLGRVDDIVGLLGAVDIAVFSSFLEGVPNGVLESMAAGLPVVATDIPGIREALGEESNDLLAPPCDSNLLAERVTFLVCHEERRETQGAKNKQRIHNEFAPQTMVDQTAQFLAQVLK